jgi:HAE1 family hydrophobic/amphiphilic exporter-1
MIGMFLVMGALGRSLNLLSLAGIAFAVGMLVDNFIVVLENIFRHRQHGDSLIAAVVSGTREVWGAVIASTLANLAVFAPVLFVHDQVGQLFHDLALAISVALGLSLLVSLIVIPTAAGHLISHNKPREDGVLGDEGNLLHRLCKPFDAFGRSFSRAVVGANAALQRSITLKLVTVAGCLGFSLFFSWWLMPKVEYLPNGNRNLAIGIMLPPPGYNIEQLNAIGEKIEAKMRKYWDHDGQSSMRVRRQFPVPGKDGKPTMKDGKPVMVEREVDVPMIGDFFYVVRGRQLFLGIRAQDPLTAQGLVGSVYEATADIPGMIVIAKQMSLFESGLGAGRTVDIEITGPDVAKLVELANNVMRQVPEVVHKETVPFPKPSADLSAPELHVIPRWDQAADLGFTAAELGYAVNALVDGAYSGDYNLGGDKIDLSIVGRNERAATMQDVRGLPLFTPQGQPVTLESVADVVLSSGPEQINRRERLRAITVSVSPPLDMPIEEAMDRIQTGIVAPILKDPKLAGEYGVNLSGTADKLRTTWLSIRWNLLLAVVITYLVIAALFESWVYPLIIMLSVPLGAVGGVIGLKLLNLFVLQPLDMFTMVGFIILVGTVVNNPILIIEQALVHMREDGMDPHASILQAVESRIRPIFMTALIGLLGLLPLVLSPGAGSELYRGLGSVTLGGLVFSTIFTLFFIPALFSLCLDAQSGALRLWRRARSAAAPAAAGEVEPPPAEAPEELESPDEPEPTIVVMPTHHEGHESHHEAHGHHRDARHSKDA